MTKRSTLNDSLIVELALLNSCFTCQIDFIVTHWYRILTKHKLLISYDLIKLITLYSKYIIEIESYN